MADGYACWIFEEDCDGFTAVCSSCCEAYDVGEEVDAFKQFYHFCPNCGKKIVPSAHMTNREWLFSLDNHNFVNAVNEMPTMANAIFCKKCEVFEKCFVDEVPECMHSDVSEFDLMVAWLDAPYERPEG